MVFLRLYLFKLLLCLSFDFVNKFKLFQRFYERSYCWVQSYSYKVLRHNHSWQRGDSDTEPDCISPVVVDEHFYKQKVK